MTVRWDTHPTHTHTLSAQQKNMRHEVTARPEKTNQTTWSEDGTAVVCMLQGGEGRGGKMAIFMQESRSARLKANSTDLRGAEMH